MPKKKINAFEFIKKNQDVLSINKIEKELGMAQGTLKKPLNGVQPLADKWIKPLENWIIARFYS